MRDAPDVGEHDSAFREVIACIGIGLGEEVWSAYSSVGISQLS